jgi:hypothetical protein
MTKDETEDLMNRFAVMTKLSFREAMDEHMEKIHSKQDEKIDALRRHQWYERGVIGAIVVALGYATSGGK